MSLVFVFFCQMQRTALQHVAVQPIWFNVPCVQGQFLGFLPGFSTARLGSDKIHNEQVTNINTFWPRRTTA